MSKAAAADYSAFVDKPSDDKFAHLSILVAQQRQAELLVEQKENELKEAQDKLRAVSEVAIPEYMEKELGLSEIVMKDKTTVKIDEKIRAGITKERGPRAFKWLREVAKAPHLIKRALKLDFAKGEDEQAKKAVTLLEANGFFAEDTETVHAQTLAAWVREKLEKGELPDEGLELLGVHRQRFCKLGSKA